MRQTVQEYLGVPASWPVIEKIKHEIVLTPNKQDIKRAKRNDPRACALRNAACRMYDVPNCAIGGRWAFIPQRDSKGKPYIARMQATAETQAAIREFDRTGEIPEGGFRFIPLAPSHMYKRKRSYMRRYHKGIVGHNSAPKPGSGPKNKTRRQFRAMPKAITAKEAA